MDIEQRISNYLILFEGKALTRKQTIAKIIHIPLSEGECPECKGYEPWVRYNCSACKGTGKLSDRDIEYAIKKCQEG